MVAILPLSFPNDLGRTRQLFPLRGETEAEGVRPSVKRESQSSPTTPRRLLAICDDHMKLSRTVSYAIRATLQLARAGSSRPIPCSRLASEGKMPERFLLQVLRSLVTHGILRSTRGVEGGYSLLKLPSELTLLEVIEAVDGPLEAAPPRGEEIPPHVLARLENAMEAVAQQSRDYLSQITFAALLRERTTPDAAVCEDTPPAVA